MPQRPWPLVQPLPRRVPSPTSRPASATSGSDTRAPTSKVCGAREAEGRTDDEHPDDKPRAPRAIAVDEQAADDTGEPGNAPRADEHDSE